MSGLANTICQFQQILAVSTGPSWRTHGLEAAANLTGLNITVPPQPPNPDNLVEAFQQIGAGTAAEQPKYGSAKAWMAHLDILKFVIASQLETTFIVEDDIDWDLAIKDQMRLVSDSVRAYNFVPSGDITPYGSDWDVLWLGHCGAMVGSNDTGKEPLLYPDDTRIDIEEYSGWSRPYIREGIPTGHRLVQDIPLAVCSFGYGVTKTSAPKVLNLLAKGAGEAFDVMLSSYCRSHQLNCLLVNPQIFNHYEPPGSDGYVSQVNGGNGQREGAEATAFENKKGFTGNIVNSSRCAALFGEQCVRPGSDLL